MWLDKICVVRDESSVYLLWKRMTLKLTDMNLKPQNANMNLTNLGLYVFLSKPHSTKCTPFLSPPPISLFLSLRRWCCRRARRSGGSSRTVTSDLHPKLCHQVQCQLSLGSSRAPTLADKHKLREKKETRDNYEKKLHHKIQNNKTTIQKESIE